MKLAKFETVNQGTCVWKQFDGNAFLPRPAVIVTTCDKEYEVIVYGQAEQMSTYTYCPNCANKIYRQEPTQEDFDKRSILLKEKRTEELQELRDMLEKRKPGSAEDDTFFEEMK